MTSTFQEGVSLPGSEKGALKSIDKNQASQLLLKGKRVHSIPPDWGQSFEREWGPLPLPRGPCELCWSRLQFGHVQSSFCHHSWQRVSRVFDAISAGKDLVEATSRLLMWHLLFFSFFLFLER
ncbi:hypothetical protein CEXT_216781 [Caerostris extrusa]|uniref:Uncharacterized protein n=1 Tax=Caerostris extrusa TaxID=172846 RepID=A0AAV4QER8_CAEEX|nr:hypothetical protein CEXT_216781 [Caerostris extrusa]